ncbi:MULTISPECIES: sensor histidine kinase [Nonomuraea]|jgi:two-component system sensor histidine kinase DesK|uniref:Sensor histidine kinase n=1 Tax=Nonomuraea salmonea TaxID=46181 RepID=A0ABV5NRL5_9ACTN
MGARPETAKKILLHWMDGTIALVGLTFVAYTVAAMAKGEIPTGNAVAALVLMVPYFGLLPFVMRDGYEDRRPPTRKLWVAGALAVVVFLLMPHGGAIGNVWLDTATLWLSLASLYFRPRTLLWLSLAVIVLGAAYVVELTDRSWPVVLFAMSGSGAAEIAAMLVWRWLWWVIRDANRGREARARLAVAEERLRFARDLHDLLGHSLSVITLKSELAAKLATKDAARAANEMAEVRTLAGESLFEVQQAVHGYQALDLDEELAGVRAALEAAGTTCVIEARTDDLSPSARTLLAWAVREGGTNILKHSTASRCAIRIDAGVLEMVNDGVAQAPAEAGSGLRGLSERLVAAGGSFSAQPTASGEFLLRAAVPA